MNAMARLAVAVMLIVLAPIVMGNRPDTGAPAHAQTEDLAAALEARLSAALESKLTIAMRSLVEQMVNQATSTLESRVLSLAQQAAEAAVRAATPVIEARIAEISNRVQSVMALEARVAALETELQAAKAMEGRIAALETELQAAKAMEARLAALEARVASLEEKEEKEEETGKPVKAPFVVVDGGGNELLRVDGAGTATLHLKSAGSHVRLTAGDTAGIQLSAGTSTTEMVSTEAGGSVEIGGSGPKVRLEADSAEARLELGGGGVLIDLSASQSTSRLRALSGQREVEILAEAGRSGLSLDSEGQRNAATLAVTGAGKPYLEMRDGGNLALHAGIGTAGRPSFGLWDSGRPAGRMEVSADGTGKVTMFADGSEAVLLGTLGTGGTSGLQVASQSGEQVFAGVSGGDPNVFIVKGGQPLVSLSVSEDGAAGAVDLFRGAERKVGLDASGASGLRVYAGDEAAMYAGVGQDGLPMLALSNGGDLLLALGPSSSSSKSGSLLMFDGGAPALAAGPLDGGGNGVQIFDGDDAVIDIGVRGRSAGLMVADGGSPRAFVGTNGAGQAEIDLLAGGGEIATLKESSDVPGTGSLVLFSGGKPGAGLQFAGSDRPVIKLQDSGGKTMFGAGVAEGGMTVLQLDSPSSPGVRMWAGAGGAGANVYSGDNLVATINSVDDPGKGILAVYENGLSVARLGVGSNGGGNVTATDPSGMGVFSAGFVPDGPGLACVNRQGMKCLGIGLTGMEGFHAP